ncbi:hypothetical protein [Corallococcus sp. 4LFB]|uniref:hypothetical protein n=1 Tax=Corallococcus sp. 4LFB TaxID=3383249 RepID=UPI003974E894
MLQLLQREVLAQRLLGGSRDSKRSALRDKRALPDRSTARSSTLRSSRMLPGQA